MNKIILTTATALLILGACTKKESYNLVFIMAENISAEQFQKNTTNNDALESLDSLFQDAVHFSNVYQNTAQYGPFQAIMLSGQHSLYNGAFADSLLMVPEKGKRIGGALQKEDYKTGYYGSWCLSDNNGNWNAVELGQLYGFNEMDLLGTKPNETVEKASGFIHDAISATDNFAVFMSFSDRSFSRGSDSIEDKTLVDTNVTKLNGALGKLIAKLKELQIYDKTIIVLTSSVSTRQVLEESNIPTELFSKIPLYIKLPDNRLKGQKSNQLLSTMDVMPTILGLLHTKVPGIAHGRDLSDEILKNETYLTASIPLFQFYPQGYRGLVSKDYLFLMKVDSGYEKGIIIKNKPNISQQYNYYNDNAYTSLKRDLQNKTVQWMDYYEDEGYSTSDVIEVKAIKAWEIPEIDNETFLRPIDELKKLHGNRIMNFHGNNSYE